MKEAKEQIAEVSQYLQRLANSSIFPEIQAAIENKDQKSILNICKKAKIPEKYVSTITMVLLSVSPQQKWPAFY